MKNLLDCTEIKIIIISEWRNVSRRLVLNSVQAERLTTSSDLLLVFAL